MGLRFDVEALDGAGLADVEPLAARHALDDVEQDDVAQLLEADEVGERAADHARADQRDLGARHCLMLPCCAALRNLSSQPMRFGVRPLPPPLT